MNNVGKTSVGAQKRLQALLCTGIVIALMSGSLAVLYNHFKSLGNLEGDSLWQSIFANESKEVAIKKISFEKELFDIFLSDPETISDLLHDNYYGPNSFELLQVASEDGLSINVTISTSRVTHVVLNAFDTFWFTPVTDKNYSTVNLTVGLCDKINHDCFPCGSVGTNSTWDVETIYCIDTTKICNQVEIFISNTIFRMLTEISIFGEEIVSEEVREIQIHRSSAFGFDGILSNSEITKVHDGQTVVSEDKCFLSESGQPDWASFEIPWSLITHVNILTAEYTKGAKEGIWVDVCSYGAECLPCGVLTLTPAGTWGGVYCLGGMIPGNEVQFQHRYSPLEICEVQIFGTVSGSDEVGVINQLKTVDMFKSLQVENISGISPLVGRLINGLSLTRDNFWGTSQNDCYQTKDHITYQTKWALIKYVKLLSGAETLVLGLDGFYFRTEVISTTLLGLKIDVCTVVGEVCEVCGFVTDDSDSSWVTVFCPGGGIEGNFVTIGYPLHTTAATEMPYDDDPEPRAGDSDPKEIELCEIEIYGEIM